MNKRDFPKASALMKHYAISFGIVVPSTRDRYYKISEKAFEQRIKMVTRYLTQRFKGATINRETGTYTLKGKVIEEKVALISAFTTVEIYNRYDKELKKFILDRKKSWGQDSIGFIFEGDMYFV